MVHRAVGQGSEFIGKGTRFRVHREGDKVQSS
jgi:hypothetical protein